MEKTWEGNVLEITVRVSEERVSKGIIRTVGDGPFIVDLGESIAALPFLLR